MNTDEDNSSKIWHVLVPYIKTSSKLTPYKCLGSDEAVSRWYKLLVGSDSGKAFWQTKRSYLANACLLIPNNYSGVARNVELKYISPCRTRCHYWYGDGALKKNAWESEFHQLVEKLAGEFFVVQIDITGIYERLKHLLEPA